MRYTIHKLLGSATLLATMLTLAGCSSEGGTDMPQPEATTAPIILTIQTPKSASKDAKTRVGDPGEATNETYEDWDQLTIIVGYTEKKTGSDIIDPEPEKMVYYDTFSKDEFDSNTEVKHTNSVLSPSSTTDGYREYTMYLPQGTVNVYGVTYTKDEAEKVSFAPETATTNEKILDMKISNDYAGDDLAKFMSVATGYATIVNDDGISTGTRDLEIIKGNDATMKKYWRMPLTRLATKLDIQWDAYQGYNDGKLEDCKVSSFQYDGGASNETGSGYGRVFPSLQASTVEAVGGKKEFYNETPISQRNGRVYHYLYPDGSKNPKITFNLDITEKDKDTNTSTATGNRSITFLLQEIAPLKQATWYKINTKIKGSSAQTEFVIGKTTNNTDNK